MCQPQTYKIAKCLSEFSKTGLNKEIPREGTRTKSITSLAKYFLLNKSFENKDIKLFYNNYKHYYIKRRKQYFNLIYHYRYLNYKRKNLNKQILKNNKINRKYIKFNRVYYLIKNRKNKLSMIKLKSLNQNLFYYFNLNLINSNLFSFLVISPTTIPCSPNSSNPNDIVEPG